MKPDKLLLSEQSLFGLSLGDAFGESLFGEESLMKARIHERAGRKNCGR